MTPNQNNMAPQPITSWVYNNGFVYFQAGGNWFQMVGMPMKVMDPSIVWKQATASMPMPIAPPLYVPPPIVLEEATNVDEEVFLEEDDEAEAELEEEITEETV